MTDEQTNIAIAESLGWKVRWQNQGGAPTLENKPAGHCWVVWTNPNGWGLDSNYDQIFPPNYTADLNACHEFEKSLNTDDAHMYYWRLKQEIGWVYASATARQRCEAYLKTLNLWIEK